MSVIVWFLPSFSIFDFFSLKITITVKELIKQYQCLPQALGCVRHGCGFACNHIAFDAVASALSVYGTDRSRPKLKPYRFKNASPNGLIVGVNGRKRRNVFWCEVSWLESSKLDLEYGDTRSAAITLEKLLKRFRVNTSTQCRFRYRRVSKLWNRVDLKPRWC